MNGIAEEDGMNEEGKTTPGLGIDPLGVIRGGGAANDGAKPADAEETGPNGYMVPRNTEGMSEADLADMASVADPLGTMRLREATLGLGLEKPKPAAPAKPRDPNAPKDGETAEDWINRVRDVAAKNDRDARMDYEMVTFLQNRAKDGTTDEEVFKYLDEYSEKRWGLHCDHGSAWNPDDGMHPFESAGDYADAMQRIVRDGWASPVSPSLRAWREAQARGDRAEMIRLAGVMPNKVEGTVFGANGVGGGGTYGGAATRPKTDAEIDEELDEYDAKMAAKDFLGVQRVLDAKWHFDERERRLINAAIDSGDGLPDEAREDFEALAYAAPERAAAVGMLVDLARRRESRWVRDNVIDPICSVAKDFFKGAVAMERGAAEAVMLRAKANAMVRDEAEGGDMDYSPRRIWNERERGEYDRIAATGNLRDAYLTAKKMCVERLVDEMKPAAERRRERLTRTLVEDSVGHQPTVEYNYLSRSVAGVFSMLPYMALSATPAGFALNVASQFEKVRDDIVRGGGDPDEALGAQLLLSTGWAAVEKVQGGRLLGRPMSGLRMRMTFANGFCEAWQKKEFREALRRVGQLARQIAKEGAKKGGTESLEETVQDTLEKGEVTWFTTKDGGKVFAEAVKAGATSFCESYLSMAMVGGFGEARNLYRARNASLDNRSLAEFASAENRAMQLYRGNLAELEGTAEQREKNLTARTRKFREECLDTVRRHREGGGGLREALAEIRERNGLTDEQTRAIGEWLDMRANVQAMAANTGARERSRLLHGAGMLPVGQDTTYDVANLMRLINPDIKVEEVTLGGVAAPETAAPPAAKDGAPDAAHPATPAAPIETAKPRMLIDGESVETKNLRERLAEAERNVANAPDKETRRKADKEARKLRKNLRSSEAADAAEERRQGEQATAAPTTEAVPGETEGTTPATPMAEPATLSPEAVGETATPPAAPQGETATASPETPSAPVEGTPTPVAEPPPSPTATEPRSGLRITVPLADGTTRSVTLVENHEDPDINTEGAATSVAAAMADMVGATNRAGQTVRGADEITDEEFAALPADKKTAFAVTEKRYMAMGEDERALYWDNNNLADGGYFMPAAAGNAYGSDGVIMVQRSLGSPFARVGGNWTVSHEYGHAVSRFMRDAGLIGERQVAVLQALFPKRDGSTADELWDEEAANNAFAEWLRDRFDFGLVPEGQREEAEGIFKTAWRVIKTLLGIGGREAPVMERERTRREEAIDAMAEAFRKGDFSGLDAFAEDTAALAPTAETETETATEAKTAQTVSPHADTPDAEASQNAAEERGAETRTTTPTDGAKPAEGGKSRPGAKPTAKTGAEAEKEAYRMGYEDALAKATADFLAKIAADPEHAKDNLPNRTGARRTLFTPNYAMKVEVEYTWAPLASILESTDDREMQMRDRKNRIATAQQVIENTRPGRFQPLALFMSLTTDTGAPIVGGGMRIISGHGRHQYLLKLDEEGRFNEYLDPINAECARQGLPTAPQGMEKPVLVARVVKGLETIEQAHRFAELSNRSGMLERSGAEYAESDARAITPALMRLYNPDESGNLLSAGNRDFMNAFIRAVGATGLTNADGTPTPEAALRVQRAMMTAIFGGDENVRAMVRQLLEQSQALGLGTVMNALTRSAGRLLALRGRHGDFDIVDDVREATRLYISWRVAKMEQPRLTFAEHLRGQDLFMSSATPMQEALARLLDTGRFGAALAKYVDLAAQEAEDGQGLLGGIVEKRTPLQVMGYAERAILPLKDGATEARTDEDYAEAPVTPHPDSDVAKSAVKVATPPVETKPVKPKPAESVAPAEPVKAADPVKPVAPTPKPKPAAKKPEPAKPEPTPAEAAAAIVEEDVKPHPFTPQPAKPQSLAPAKHGEKFAFERDGEKTTLPGGAWNHLRVPFKYGKDKAGNALPIPSSPQDGRGRGLWAPSYPWGAKDRARRDALLAQWGGRCPKYMGNKNSMTLRTVAAIHDQMSPEERAHYTALNDCFGGGGCWGLTLAMTCFTNVRRITVNEFEEGRLEKIRLMHTLDGEMGDRLRAFLERTDLVEKARKVVLVSADGKVRKATWNGQDCRDRTFAAAREFMDELTADERGLLFALLDNMQSRMQYGAGELVDGKYDFDAMVKAAVRGVAEEAIAATEMADAFKARGGSIVYVAGDSKLQKSFGARRDTKRTDAEVYTRGGDGDAYAVEHGDHVVSVCDPPYYRTTGYDNGNKTTVGLAENPMGWGYEDTRAMLRAVVDGGDALVYTDEAWWLNSEYRAETDEGDFMEGDLFGGAFGPTSVYARENAVLQDIVNLLDHFDVAGGVASRQEVLGVHHGHRNGNDHQSADGAVLRAADDAAGGGLPADGGRVHGRDDQAVGAVDGGDAAQDGAAHGQDAQGDGRGGSGEADDAAGGRHSVRVGAGTAALARAVLARELADEIQREKPHLPRAVAHGAARNAIRARYEAASGAARHSVRAEREYDEVVARYTNADGTKKRGWMLAPNGKPTDLDERQWVQVRTPSFKRWFGDWEKDPANASKVVAENGEPMPVYHGTGEDFTVFDIDGRGGGAAYFTPDKDYAASHYGAGAVAMECFLNVRNLLSEEEAYDKYGVDFSALNEQEIDKTREAVDRVKADGYDGVRGTTFDSDSNEKDAIAVFSPDQIKSATDNTGAFDAGDADIRHSVTISPNGMSRWEATASLDTLKGGNFFNAETRIFARLSSTGAGKLVSNAAAFKTERNGFTKKQHNALAARIDELFYRAHLIEDRADRDGDVNIKSIKRFVCPVQIGDEEAGAYITVKESVEHGHRIYSVEGMKMAALSPMVRRAISDRNSADNAATPNSVAYPGGGAQAESAARRDSADAERHSIHVGWRSDFPKAVCMTTRASLMAKHGEDFHKAKAGDEDAAARLVKAVSKPDKIKALVAAHPNASIVCPVHAEEATGRNKIPAAFAAHIASVAGIECDDEIVQTVRANHTGSNAAHRLFVSPEFAGEVKKGAEYIVVDDHITQGGTVNALRDHIESHGGKVVAVASLTLSQGSSTLAPTQETIDAVRRKHEGIDQTLKALGIADGVECLTQSECRYLASLSPDGLRDRIASARQEGHDAQDDGAVREAVAPANERERHSLIVSVPTSGVRLRAKGEARRLLDEKFHGEYNDEARERIYAATGWWKGIDGKWRIEIPNPTARTKISKKRTVPKSLRGNWECVNGLYVNRDRDEYHCRLEDMVDFPSGLVSAFPIIPSINVRIVNGNGDEMAGKYAFWDGRGIALNWDLVEWRYDEPTTIPTEQGVATLTHELQHVIQDYSGFASGASANVHGKWNYAHSAGEVEARNAERRRTDIDDEDGNASIFHDLATDFTMDGQDANGDLRETAIETNNAPWQTEDVPSDEQVITKWDAKRGPITTDRMGNLVPRHSVTAGRGGGMRRQDMAVAFLAQRVLAGREATVDEAAAVLKSLGLGALPAGETLAKAKKIAEDNRARLKKETEESSPKVFATLAAANLAEDMGVALDRLITRSADATDPEVGRRVQKMAHDHEARSLAAANGFTAAEMAAEMPIDLAQGLLAVKEYEKTPEEKARLEAERAKREEERRRRMEEDDRTDEEMLADAEADHLREPTAEERAAFDALMDRARFADEQRKAEEQRRKLADAQRKRNGADGAAEDAEGDGEGDGADGADALEAGTLSKETVARIAPVFESAELFAQFLIEWTSDKTLDRHPELPATAQMWKSPVAVRELKQTATAILRDLARRALGTPMHNHARNYADHLINELESDAQLKTYASVRRMVARIYGVIHDDALRLTRRQLVDRLVNGWREGETTHMGIRQLAGVKGRFSATAEAAQRAIDGRTEQWARTLVKVIYLSEAKTAQREQELEAIVNFDPTAEDAGDAPTPDAVREAADELAIIRRYGGLRRMMPGQISELSDEILDLLNGKRQAFEAERLEREAKCAKVREAFIAAVGAGRAPKPKGKKNFLVRWLEAFQGNVDLEMRSLYRHCADEAKRQAASDAVDELMVAISEAGSVYRTEAARGRAEVQRGLAAAYGSAEAGIKHLAEPLPPEVADAIFSQSRDLVPTYGHLLQLYASAIQKDYAENVKKHGRDRQLALMRSTLTAGDMAFHAWAAQWYAAGRARLSDAVEAVTGVPVTSPDNCYVPVRVKRPAQGFAAEVSAWSPIPRALSKRIPHALDFDEGADFLSLLLEQVETRAQTIGKAGLGIELRDTLAHRDVQDAVRRSVGAEEMRQVADHLRDIVMEDVGRDRDRTLDLLDLARGWVARFGISGNLKSVMAQPASIPVWGNVMLGGRSIGLGRVAYYLAHVDRDAIAELVESDGFSARYEMGWSEEVQNILKNPSRNRVIRSVERVYDLGMKPSQYADRCATLWVAQGFYRDARQRYLDMGETEAEAKRKALALTWAAVEATQQTGRTEYMNRAQRGRSGSIARAVFQFRTAQLLSNNYLIQALRDARAGTPGAKGRLARAAVISTVVVPAYMMAVSALWDALMGEEPPEDEERWPTLMKEMAWSMVDGVTAPLFVANTLAESTVKPLLGIGGFGSGSGIPALDSTKRLAVHAGKAAKDAAAWLGQNLGAFELEEEMTLDKIMADLGRLAQDAAAPVRQTARALRNWLGREE